MLDVTHPEPLPVGHRLLALPNVRVTAHIAGGLDNEVPRPEGSAVTEIAPGRLALMA